MKSSNNELIIQRGEQFGIDRIVQNEDGSPYILSKELKNPYLRLIVSSSKFEEAAKQEVAFYLNLSSFPRFLYNNPIPLSDLKASPDGESLYDDWPDLTAQLVDGKTIITQCYYNGELVAIEADDFVFYKVNENGVREYKYASVTDSTVIWNDYSLRFAIGFSSSETIKWVAPNYFYSIDVVTGESTDAYLRSLALENDIEFSTCDETYEALKAIGVTFVSDFDCSAPLVKIETSLPLLLPTRISVLNNLKGGYYA